MVGGKLGEHGVLGIGAGIAHSEVEGDCLWRGDCGRGWGVEC